MGTSSVWGAPLGVVDRKKRNGRDTCRRQRRSNSVNDTGGLTLETLLPLD